MNQIKKFCLNCKEITTYRFNPIIGHSSCEICGIRFGCYLRDYDIIRDAILAKLQQGNGFNGMSTQEMSKWINVHKNKEKNYVKTINNLMTKNNELKLKNTEINKKLYLYDKAVYELKKALEGNEQRLRKLELAVKQQVTNNNPQIVEEIKP